MATEASALIGSGTVEFTKNILTPAQRGSNPDTRGGFRQGTQVMLGNPEDLLSVDAWAVSGVVVNETPAQIVGPHINMLGRIRTVILENVGSGDATGPRVFVGPTEALATAADGFEIPAPAMPGTLNRLELPLLHNNEIWAATESANTIIKIIVY